MINKKRFIPLFLMAITIVFCSSAADPVSDISTHRYAADLALINGILIDGTGSPPVPDAIVLIKDGKIAAVGKSTEIAVPKNARIYDLSGGYILPGFINAHVHGGYARNNLFTWVCNGVTAVRDLGTNMYPETFSERDAFNSENGLARLISAGPMVTVPGGYPYVPWGSSIGMSITSADDAKAKIESLISDGAGLIKVAVESGESFQRDIPTFSEEVLRKVVDTAHSNGVKVSAHVLTSYDLNRALKAGADDIAHMVAGYLPDSLITEMVRKNVYWVPTLELWHLVSTGTGNATTANLRRYVQAGGLVAMGTDFAGYDAVFDTGMPLRELGWMKEAGMTPMQIIVASTRNAAIVSGKDDLIGTVEPGKTADIIVSALNPLVNLQALGKLKMVIHNGEIIVNKM